ncbi:uncharacterized protein LOC125674995 [Ostrea edulis]|uniref:uncharacterized protein LOC125674995 n=1 Tax=Ostrea edulis TaxID=37623 RepID=UPI0024AEC48E|nr:uncharacterized protein LOC125674995 [Ostrea edulis]
MNKYGKQCNSSAGLRRTFVILILISNGLKLCLSYDEEFCGESQTTVSRVSKCPTTKSTWEERALRKSCSSIPHTCSGDLSYHCLINPWQNITLEVCAPRVKIPSGHCAEYSSLGGRVQEYYERSCSSCVSDYLSTDAYQYDECYKAVYDRFTINRGTEMTSLSSQIWIYYHSILLSSMISGLI